MKNGLYIVATPIGNLGDISLRAIETLKKSDIIICENPNHSVKLLSKLDIKKKLISLHDYNEEIVIENIQQQLKTKKFSLISDAGSPLISDPGYKLVRYCFHNKIHFTTIPGPSSIIGALQISTIPINSFFFSGFVPKSKKGVDELINELQSSEITRVLLISSHKILSFLELMSIRLSQRKLAVVKELTKINEKVFIGPALEVYSEFKKNSKNSLGEFVIIVERDDKKIKKRSNKINSEKVDIIKKLLKKFSLTDTVEIVHKISNNSKNEIYENALRIKNKK